MLSKVARDQLDSYRNDLNDLSSRLGATKFGTAEDIDPLDFETLRYDDPRIYRTFRSCCKPEVDQATSDTG